MSASSATAMAAGSTSSSTEPVNMQRDGLGYTALERLRVTRAACLAMIASAVEVFPKECMGSVCALQVPTVEGRICGAFPYQLARRSPEEVSSLSSWMFLDLLSEGGPWVKIGDYHSHTYRRCKKIEELLPSGTDLEGMGVGDVEIIVQVCKTKQCRNSWRGVREGIRISWGKYRFLLKGFLRLEGRNQEGDPLYRTVELSLVD